MKRILKDLKERWPLVVLGGIWGMFVAMLW